MHINNMQSAIFIMSHSAGVKYVIMEYYVIVWHCRLQPDVYIFSKAT